MSVIGKISSLFKGGSKVVVGVADDAAVITSKLGTVGTKVAAFISGLPVIRIIAGSSIGLAIYEAWKHVEAGFEDTSRGLSELLGISQNQSELLMAVFLMSASVLLLVKIKNIWNDRRVGNQMDIYDSESFLNQYSNSDEGRRYR